MPPYPVAGARLNELGVLARMLAARISSDRCFQVAGSLTFTTLLALVPLITVALSVASLFPVYQHATDALRGFLIENIVPQSVEVIVRHTHRFAENAAQLTIVGVLGLGVTAIMLLHTIEDEFNQIWRITSPRPLLRRVLIYLALLTLGPVLIGASLSLTSVLVSLSLGLASEVPALAVFMLGSVPVLLTSLAFALIYLTLPNRRVAIRDACLSGATAGVGFEVMKECLALYVAHFPTYELVYGAFAAIPVFLLWIYLSWLLMLGGAVLAAVLPDWRASAWRTGASPGSDFIAALGLLKLVFGSDRESAITLGAACSQANLAVERAERLLDAMAGARWIKRVGVEEWRQCRPATEIRLLDVYRMFVFSTAAAREARLQGLGGWLSNVMRGGEDASSMTLADWLGAPESVDAEVEPARMQAAP